MIQYKADVTSLDRAVTNGVHHKKQIVKEIFLSLQYDLVIQKTMGLSQLDLDIFVSHICHDELSHK